MNINSKVSVITPILGNDLNFLSYAADNIRKQLYNNIEWVIVSENNIKADEFECLDGLNVTLIHESNSLTPGYFRNIGIEKSSGDYLYFYDVDDHLHEHTIYCLMDTITREDDVLVMGPVAKSHLRPLDTKAYSDILTRLVENRHINLKKLSKKKVKFSCLNSLVKADFIKENSIRFEDLNSSQYAMSFMTKLYTQADRILYDKDARYTKIQRNDTVRYPSLSNRTSDNNISTVPYAYISCVKDVELSSRLKKKLDKWLLKFYRRNAYKIHSIKESDIQEQVLNLWTEALLCVETKYISKKGVGNKLRFQEISALKKGKYAKSKTISKGLRIAIDTKKFATASKAAKGKAIYRNILTTLPIQDNVIMFESFLGKNMSDSPKYIYKYLSDTYKDKYKYVWVFNEIKEDLPEEVIQVKRFSPQHLYYIATSKYWVSNMRQPKWYQKREGQIFLATWHGTPLKRLVFDMDEVHSASKTYKQDFYQQSRSWDCLISANRYSTDIFKSAFLFDKPILELGYPRNDLLHYDNKDEIARELKEKLGIPLDKKIVLYAPTWRDDDFYKPGKYKFKLKLDLERLRDELGDEYYFVLRTHYFIADHLDVEGLEDFVYNASKYDDITELYLISDALITDYSSVFFDYANLKRPMLFFTYDLEKYRDTLRGFYLDMENDLPGPLLMDNDEIINALRDFDKLKADYKDKIENFYNQFCYLEDGKASMRIAEEVIVKNTLNL